MGKKGPAIFLGITLGVTYAVLLLLPHLPHFGQVGQGLQALFVPVALLMAPALAALLASSACGDPEYPKLPMWPLPKNVVLTLAVAIPLLFALHFSLSAVLGWAQPDWQIKKLMLSLAGSNRLNVPPSFFIVVGSALSLVLGPTLYALPCLASEIGWRGYLFPKLLPLGRVRAHLLLGFFMWLWCLPFVVPFRGLSEGSTTVALCLLGTALSVNAVLSELWLAWPNVGITAVACGCYLSQCDSLWTYLFPDARLPYAGTLSLMAMLVWLLTAVGIGMVPKRPAQARL